MLEHYIETYGYLAVMIGTFLEGETILVLAGFAAHQGYLQSHLADNRAILHRREMAEIKG